MTILPPDPDLDALRLELGRLRAERGWSYDELASRSGLGRRTVIEIEQGRTIILKAASAFFASMTVSRTRAYGW
ncbi:helix-turn-helix transcriptional regulator [Streptomyces sp. NPDC001089]